MTQKPKTKQIDGKQFKFLGRYSTKSSAESIAKRNKIIHRSVRIVEGKDCSFQPCIKDYSVYVRDTKKTKEIAKTGANLKDKWLSRLDISAKDY